MTDHNQRIPPPPIMQTGSTNIEPLKPLIAEFNKVIRWLQQVRAMNPDLGRIIDPEIMRLTYVFGIDCEPESSGSEARDAILQYFDGTDFVDTTKPVTKSNLKNPFGDIPYDADDTGPVFYHRQSGQFLPTWVRTIRHCRTVSDSGGDYPTQASVGSGHPVVYPFRWTRIEFIESPGTAYPDTTFLCPDSTYDGYFLNLYCNDFDAYLPEGTDVWIYNVTGQWFTYAAAAECESASSASSTSESSSISVSNSSESSSSGGSSLSSSSSSSSSNSSSESSSNSSSSSSSNSSSESSSSESSLSVSSASSLSVSSASSLSANSSASSESSSVSSGGSSASSDLSSGGSSLSSCPACEGEEVEVVTGITANFDADTCELTITTNTIRICFPTGSGIVVCG